MSGTYSEENIIRLISGSKKNVWNPGKLKVQSYYKIVLFLSDFLMAMLGSIMGLLIFGIDPWRISNAAHPIVVISISFLVLSFFSTYYLYNYHFIFSVKNHSLSIAKAYCWGALTLGIVVLLFTWSDLVDKNIEFLFIFMSLAAIFLLLVSRYLWEHQLYLIKALGIGFIIIGIISFFIPDENPVVLEHYRAICAGFFLSTIIVVASRLFLVHVVFNIWARRQFRRQIVIFGTNQEAKNITNHIINVNAPFWVTGIVDTIKNCRLETRSPKECLGDLNDLPGIVKKKEISEIIITSENINKQTLIVLLDFCAESGVNAWFPPDLLKIIDSKLVIDNFCGLEMVRLCAQKNSWLFNKIKYGLDALITLPVFLIQLPVFLLIAMAIKISSKGPVFYLAKAIGKNGMIFNMFKFRSMTADNQSDLHKAFVTKLIKGEISNDGDNDQPLKITNDSRITAVGKLLRKYSLDELPQLINVLKGDMSLVGPRPCLPYEYEIYREWHKKRTAVRPGITGLWQVAGRSEVSFEDMILLDLYYMYNRTLLLDLNILLETIFVVLTKKGAY